MAFLIKIRKVLSTSDVAKPQQHGELPGKDAAATTLRQSRSCPLVPVFYSDSLY